MTSHHQAWLISLQTDLDIIALWTPHNQVWLINSSLSSNISIERHLITKHGSYHLQADLDITVQLTPHNQAKRGHNRGQGK